MESEIIYRGADLRLRKDIGAFYRCLGGKQKHANYARSKDFHVQPYVYGNAMSRKKETIMNVIACGRDYVSFAECKICVYCCT